MLQHLFLVYVRLGLVTCLLNIPGQETRIQYIEEKCDPVDENEGCRDAVNLALELRDRCMKYFYALPLMCLNTLGKQLQSRGVTFQSSKAFNDVCKDFDNPDCSSEIQKIPGTELEAKMNTSSSQNQTKRSIILIASGPFNPKFYWHQEVDGDYNFRKSQCCITTRRTVPFTAACGKHCYPVYCPLAGGYQWMEQIYCKVTKRRRPKYNHVIYPSRGKKCKRCDRAYTYRSYMVTNVPPRGFFGHCFYNWLPIWYKMFKIFTNCYCVG